MAYNSLELADKLTKNIFRDGILDQVIQSAPLFKSMRRSPLGLGKDLTGVIQTAYEEGIGVRDRGEDLPVPQDPDFENPTWDARFHYLVLTLEGVDLIRTANSKRAMGNLLMNKIEKAAINFGLDAEREMFGNQTGQLAVVEGAVTSGATKTVTVEAANIPLKGLRPNMTLDFYNETTGQKITEGLVTSVNKSAGTFVVASLATALPDAAGIYRKGNRNREWNGLTNLVNDSTGAATVLGLASTLDRWQSKVSANGGTARNLTIPLVDDLFYDLAEETDIPPDCIWIDQKQMKYFVQAHTRNLEYSNATGQSMTLNGHHEIEKFGNASVKMSHLAPAGKMFMLHMSDFMLDEQQAFRWITEENASNIWQKIRGRHAFEATAMHIGEVVCESRRLHGVINDLQKT